ncbi:exonuclease subunit SbcD [Oceanimonas sp. GK1]|uniref:exonuclease subunit SbcD n=1 Tax=Oceanimonas sp. (strain GK1 / IBRC-M 10197) TaxID=511062 RepID=UPI0002494D6E|nr:exonuclease subunit SbcD [Oceanimonas sp. GK1]AEX99890.1 exonuclease subunit SbcD [Oceanimonas sp. GK1]
MRILHTSDWHLGQHFMGKTRLDEHTAFLDWLVEQVNRHEVDALLVAGDIFDTGTPPSYARELYHNFVVAMSRTGASLVLLGGNHDSVAMLNESRELLGALNVRVIPGALAEPEQQLITLANRRGEPAAVLCAIPFLRPRDLLESRAGDSADDKGRALQQAIAGHYQQLFEQAQARRVELGGELPIVATGHLTTVGASSSDSVREIYIGTLEAFPASAFPAADYIALGHIHRPQKVAGCEHIRYSGSPLALGFDEAGQQKEVLLVELAPSGLQGVTPLPVPVFQPLARVSGSLTELERRLPEAAAAGTPERPVWLEVTVTEDDYLSDLQPRVQALCEELAVEVLLVRRGRRERGATLMAEQKETLSELTPEQVFERRLAAEELAPDEATGLHGLYARVLADLKEHA